MARIPRNSCTFSSMSVHSGLEALMAYASGRVRCRYCYIYLSLSETHNLNKLTSTRLFVDGCVWIKSKLILRVILDSIWLKRSNILNAESVERYANPTWTHCGAAPGS